MLLAREALILHLQHNTDFTVKTLMVNLWGQRWKDYVDDEVPAFFLLTDAENIPWKEGKLKATMQYFFRCFLFHCQTLSNIFDKFGECMLMLNF